MDIKSDILFLAGLGLSPAKLDPPQIGVDVIEENLDLTILTRRGGVD